MTQRNRNNSQVAVSASDRKARSPDGGNGPNQSGLPDHALEAFRLEFDYLCRTLRRFGIREADVEDLVHEVFLVLHDKWSEYDPRRPLRPYLFGITFRVAAQHRRRHSREVSGEIPEQVSKAPSPDRAVSVHEARSLALLALERLPLPRRAVFVMHDLDEIPMREIASSMGISLYTAYSRLRKARQEFERAVSVLQGGAR